jgi:hypothetical protein
MRRPQLLHVARYTHTLPDAMKRAREHLDAFLREAAADASYSRRG